MRLQVGGLCGQPLRKHLVVGVHASDEGRRSVVEPGVERRDDAPSVCVEDPQTRLLRRRQVQQLPALVLGAVVDADQL